MIKNRQIRRLKFLKLRYLDFLRKDINSDIDKIFQVFYTALSAKYNITKGNFMFIQGRGEYNIITDFKKIDKKGMCRFDIENANKVGTINKPHLLSLLKFQFNPNVKQDIIESSKIIKSIIIEENKKYKYTHVYEKDSHYVNMGKWHYYYDTPTKRIKGLRFKKEIQ